MLLKRTISHIPFTLQFLSQFEPVWLCRAVKSRSLIPPASLYVHTFLCARASPQTQFFLKGQFWVGQLSDPTRLNRMVVQSWCRNGSRKRGLQLPSPRLCLICLRNWSCTDNWLSTTKARYASEGEGKRSEWLRVVINKPDHPTKEYQHRTSALTCFEMLEDLRSLFLI